MNQINYQELVEKARDDQIEQLAVGAVILIDGKFLLLERQSDDFLGGLVETPGGKTKENESLKDALKRETFEETGLEIKEIKKYIGAFDYLSGSGKSTRIFNFLAVPRKGKITINPQEHSRYLFKDIKEIELEKLNISKECFEMLKSA